MMSAPCMTVKGATHRFKKLAYELPCPPDEDVVRWAYANVESKLVGYGVGVGWEEPLT